MHVNEPLAQTTPVQNEKEEHMSTYEISGSTALVTGASRGFGRAIAIALSDAGSTVVGVARDPRGLEELRSRLGETFVPVAADAADPNTAGELVDRYRPTTLVLNAGARPLARPIQHHTWQTFSRNWEVDAAQAFHWTREALLSPLDPGSTVIAMSSGAAVNGSPLSGGYAGAKAMVRFVTSYAATESERHGLGIRFVSVLPSLTPATDLGAAAVAAYARRQGVGTEAFLAGVGPTLTSEQVGKAVTELALAPGQASGTFLLSPAGLTPAA